MTESTSQQRLRERKRCEAAGIPVTPWAARQRKGRTPAPRPPGIERQQHRDTGEVGPVSHLSGEVGPPLAEWVAYMARRGGSA